MAFFLIFNVLEGWSTVWSWLFWYKCACYFCNPILKWSWCYMLSGYQRSPCKSRVHFRWATCIRNVASGNSTRGFAAREFHRGLFKRGNMSVPSLARSRIPPATQAKWESYSSIEGVKFHVSWLRYDLVITDFNFSRLVLRHNFHNSYGTNWLPWTRWCWQCLHTENRISL